MSDYLGALATLGAVLVLMAIPLAAGWLWTRSAARRRQRRRSPVE